MNEIFLTRKTLKNFHDSNKKRELPSKEIRNAIVKMLSLSNWKDVDL